MSDESRVDALLSRWHQARARGEDIPVSQLCSAAPELAPEVGRVIAGFLAQQRLDGLRSLPARLGPFVLRARLGQGGMGQVYRAEDPALGRDVAVKVIRP